MAWSIGAYSPRIGGVYLHRTPLVKDRVPHVFEGATADEFSALVEMFELMGREPLDVATVRAILGPRALMGERE